MIITDVEAIWLQLPVVDERCDGTQDTLFVRVHTDAGIVGVGEVDSSPMVAKAIIEAPLSHAIARGLRQCVLGQNPLDIAVLWERMYQGTIFFGRGGATLRQTSDLVGNNGKAHTGLASPGPGPPARLPASGHWTAEPPSSASHSDTAPGRSAR